MAYAIERSCVNKAEVVGLDEREGGVRATLNLGHTFGHAMETSQGYGAHRATAACSRTLPFTNSILPASACRRPQEMFGFLKLKRSEIACLILSTEDAASFLPACACGARSWGPV
jgi:hypothetical protein